MIVAFDSMTPDDRIIKCIATLNKKYPFFARIMLSLDRHPVDEKSNIKTLGVNKFGHLFFNTAYVKNLSFDHLQAAVSHECGHLAFLSFDRQKNRDHELWNIATDIAINYILVDAGMSLHPDWLVPEKDGTMKLPAAKLTINVKDLPAEKIYELLEKQSEKVKANYKSQDSHLEGDSDGDGGNTGEAASGDAGNQQNQHKWKQICANAAAFAKNRGTLSGAIERVLDGILNPKLNWKELLNKYITREIPYNYSYSKPGKKSYATGVYMPSIVKENLNVVITCDVSGSVSPKEYKDFMSEVLGIITAYDQVNARVMFWSTYIDQLDDRIVDRDSAQDLLTYKAHSSGGTEISCVARYMQEKSIESRIVIHLTDGCVESNPILPDCINICVISSNGTDDILKDKAICCSLNDDGE